MNPERRLTTGCALLVALAISLFIIGGLAALAVMFR